MDGSTLTEQVYVGIYEGDELIRIVPLDNPADEFSHSYTEQNKGSGQVARPLNRPALPSLKIGQAVADLWTRVLGEVLEIYHNYSDHVYLASLNPRLVDDFDPMLFDLDDREGCFIEQIRKGFDEAHEKVERIKKRFELVVSELDLDEIRREERTERLLSHARACGTSDAPTEVPNVAHESNGEAV